MQREIQKQFIRFGKIAEIVPISNYGKSFELELQMRAVSEKIGDTKARDQIRNENSQAKINKLITKEQDLHVKQRKVIDNVDKDKMTKEYIVVFDNVKSRNECLIEYIKFSHWWSRPHKQMPDDLRLHGKYAYKVKEAHEPFDYILENWYMPRWLNWILFLVWVTIAIILCTLILVRAVKWMNRAYDNIPIYTECDKYYFDTVTASSYLSATSSNTVEVSCFCRHLGYDTANSGGDNTSLCQYWLDYFPKYYKAFFSLIF